MNSENNINITLSNGYTLDDFLVSLTRLGIGGEGSCYLFKGRALKIFDGPEYMQLDNLSNENDFFSLTNYNYTINENAIPSDEYIMRYSNIKNKTFAFIDGLFKVNGKTFGYFIPLITIPKLANFKIANTKLDNLIKACKKCTSDVKLISNLGIEITDFADVNIYFNGKQIQIADTLEYEDHVDANKNVFKINSMTVSKFFVEYFTRGNIKRSMKLNKNILSLYEGRHELECSSIFFSELKTHLSEICETSINTISNAEKILSKKTKNNSKFK